MRGFALRNIRVMLAPTPTAILRPHVDLCTNCGSMVYGDGGGTESRRSVQSDFDQHRRQVHEADTDNQTGDHGG